MTSMLMNNTIYISSMLHDGCKQPEKEYVSSFHESSLQKGEQFCIPSPYFLPCSLVHEEAPLVLLRRLPPQPHKVIREIESILGCASAALSKSVQCVRIYLQVRARKGGYPTVQYITLYLCINLLRALSSYCHIKCARNMWSPSSGIHISAKAFSLGK